MRPGPPALRLSLLGFFALTPLFAQAPAPTPSDHPSKTGEASFASEPYVIELLQTDVRFESDGKGQRDMHTRIRVQSESAVREFGLLVYPYMASFENLRSEEHTSELQSQS